MSEDPNTRIDPEQEAGIQKIADSFWRFASTLTFWDYLSRHKNPEKQFEAILETYEKQLLSELRAYTPPGQKANEERIKRVAGLVKDNIRENAMIGLAWMKQMKRKQKVDKDEE